MARNKNIPATVRAQVLRQVREAREKETTGPSTREQIHAARRAARLAKIVGGDAKSVTWAPEGRMMLANIQNKRHGKNRVYPHIPDTIVRVLRDCRSWSSARGTSAGTARRPSWSSDFRMLKGTLCIVLGMPDAGYVDFTEVLGPSGPTYVRSANLRSVDDVVPDAEIDQ